MLVHHISRYYRDNQSIGPLAEESVVSSIEWLMGLHD